MTIAIEKLSSSNKRFMMARLTVGYVSTDWVPFAFTNAQIWSIPMPYPVAGVQSLGGFEYAEEPSNPLNMTSEAWFWDSATETLYVWHVDSATSTPVPPNDPAGDVMVVEYYLLLSDAPSIESGIDPTTDPNGRFAYENRLERGITVGQSWEDILAGVLSVSSTTLRLFNADGWLSAHTTSAHSFSQRAVSIWFCIDTPSNAVLIYEGKIQSVSPLSGDMADFGLFDAFAGLNVPATMSDPSHQTIMRRQLPGFPSLTPDDDGQPLRYVAGLCSYAEYITTIASDGASKPLASINEAEHARCSSYTETISTSTNRTWHLCRVPAGGLRTQSIGTVQLETSAGPNRRYVRFSTHDLRPGEWVQWTNGVQVYFALVVTVGTFTVGVNTYNCALLDDGPGYPTIAANTINHMSVPIIEIRSNSSPTTHRIDPRDFTRVYTTASGDQANRIVSIVFFNNFEANYPGIGVLDPKSHTVRFVAIPAASPLAGAVAKRILEAAGFTCNAASFAAADVTLGLKALMTIPHLDETDYRTYREYLQDLLRSMGAFVKPNSAGEIELHLFAAPSPSVTVDSSKMLDGSLAMEIDYNDVVFELQPSNPHIPTWEATNTGDNPDTVASDDDVAMLHRNSKTLVFRHVLETITDRVGYLLTLRSTPRRIYSFATATDQCDAELGDDLTLEHELIPGGSADVKIHSLEKSSDRITVRAMELP